MPTGSSGRGLRTTISTYRITPERPDTPHQILANLDLVTAIVSDELCGRYREEGGIVPSERDLGFALELLAAAHYWLNKLDIAEVVAAERERIALAAVPSGDDGDAA
jgi:hypothetical protein